MTMSSDCSDDDSIDSIEEIEDVKSSRPVPRSRHKPGFVSPRPRSTSPHSVLNVNSGDTQSLQLCLDTYNSLQNNKAVPFPSVIPLNVGGIKYMTRLSTLRKFPDSMLAALFSGRYQVDKDVDGNYFLDSNGILFGYILEYLRNGLLPPKEQAVSLYREASYYGIHDLVDRLQFMPLVVSLMVKEAHAAQFPNYRSTKEEIIKIAMEHASFTKVGEVIVYAFKSEFVPKVSTFNPNHGCVVEAAHIKVGPWDAPIDEEIFIRCIENDLQDEGFNIKPHEAKRKCRYYHGQSCQKCVYRLQITF